MVKKRYQTKFIMGDYASRFLFFDELISASKQLFLKFNPYLNLSKLNDYYSS